MANMDLTRTYQIAFLKPSKQEKENIEKSILRDIEGIRSAGDLSSVKPTTRISCTIKYRQDEVVASSKREDLLKNAKDSSNGAFTVPKIVE